MTYDAIIVGAGPAGSTTARLLAREGAKVLLLDKQKFPRDKPCGGGVTLRAASELDIDLTPVIEQTVFGARFSLRLRKGFDRQFEKPLSYMTQRARLDSYLAECAAKAGAEFHDGEAVRAINPQQVPVVRTDHGTYTSQVLIGADGANGVVAAATGLRPGAEHAVALEGNLPASGDLLEDWHDHIGMDLGDVAGGYGWVFPKGDHLNVGVGGWSYAGSMLRPKLARLARSHGFDPDKLEHLRGHRLPLRVPGTAIADGRVALVGDAAGLIDPLTGEGIHMAFASGRLVAESAISLLTGEVDNLSGYQRAVDYELQRELDASATLRELFHLAPPPYVALMRRNEKFWRFFCYLIRGDLTYVDFMRIIGPLRFAVNYLSAAARRHREAKVAAGKRLLASGSAA
ncbi:MAG: NAD(P)/FAD-dependent oxidoreductase [Chloroflexi bacterium]|nr:NAD(P)/FAD-dependent oxidoreductase [Chloroflexota bacterium]